MPVPWPKLPHLMRGSDYTAEAYWYHMVYTEGEVLYGVILLMSTVQSIESGSPSDWDVYWLPHASCECILGFPTRVWLGRAGDIPAYQTVRNHGLMAHFMREYLPRPPYHALARYSKCVSDDQRHHAVDLYWQGPEGYIHGVYHHHVLLDITTPGHWQRAQHIRMQGKMRIEDSI